MSGALVPAALLAAGVALLLGPAARTPTLPGRTGQAEPRSRTEGPIDERSVLLRLRPVLAACALLGVWTFVGAGVGLALGCVAAVVAWRVLGRAESPAVRREREQLERDLPLGVDLLATCLRGGGSVEPALAAVADAVGGPLARRLLTIRHRLALGADPVGEWQRVASDPVLGPLGRAVARSYGSGSSVVDAVEALAADLRERAHTAAQVRANGVEVRAAAPLGACFLPAFVLLGVVPLVAGVVSGMDLLR